MVEQRHAERTAALTRGTWHRSLLGCLLMAVGALGGIVGGGGGAAPLNPPRHRGPLPHESFANAVRADDPRAEGQWGFLHETWGAELSSSWPPAWFLEELLVDEESFFGTQFYVFGTVFDPRDTLPVGLKRGTLDDTRVHETCALCHASELPDGQRWLGVPNRRLDLGALKVEVNARWVAAGYPSLLSDEAIARLSALGPGRLDAATDPTSALAIPVDSPALFDLRDQNALGHTGAWGDLRTAIASELYRFGVGAPAEPGTAPAAFRPRSG